MSLLRSVRALVVVLVVASVLCLLAPASPAGETKTLARCGQGWLESIDGYLVLHLAGTPYEMGYQHGALLKDHVRENMNYLVNVKGATPIDVGPVRLDPRAAIGRIARQQEKFVPPYIFEELAGLAAGSGVPLEDARMGNFIPEMFHCSGFAVMNSATVDGELFHGRVLDYAIDWQLQEHAVLIVAQPAGAIPFVNVSYAGFIGSVTGMNAAHVSVGEMGGGGLGHWNGVPMAFLVREVLQKARNLDEAIAIFRDSPRTCQYFYVVADGNTNRAVGMEASWNAFFTVGPGERHDLLPTPVKDAVLLSAGNRYHELVRRAQAAHGRIDAEGAMRLMDPGVAMKSNLHDALFAPKSTRLWVANASKDKRPAAEQPYHAFQLTELLSRQPDSTAPQIPLLAPTKVAGK